MKCLTHNIEVNYPCSSACPLYGDCIASFSQEVKRRVRTNADHIRAMSDEELSEFLCGVFDEDDSDAKYIDGVTIPDYDEESILWWLQQPYKEDET